MPTQDEFEKMIKERQRGMLEAAENLTRNLRPLEDEVRKQIKPIWCPYEDCRFKLKFQSIMCVGELPEPELHDPDNIHSGFNTHRFCLNETETGHGIHDLKLNRGDAWLMRKLLDVVIG